MSLFRKLIELIAPKPNAAESIGPVKQMKDKPKNYDFGDFKFNLAHFPIREEEDDSNDARQDSEYDFWYSVIHQYYDKSAFAKLMFADQLMAQQEPNGLVKAEKIYEFIKDHYWFVYDRLGEIYAEGFGRTKDEKRAFDYYNQAAKMGSYDGFEYLKTYYLSPNYIPDHSQEQLNEHYQTLRANRDEMESLEYDYQKSILLYQLVYYRDPEALYEVGSEWYHLESIVQGLRWVAEAAEANYLDAVLLIMEELNRGDKLFPDHELSPEYGDQALSLGSVKALEYLYFNEMVEAPAVVDIALEAIANKGDESDLAHFLIAQIYFDNPQYPTEGIDEPLQELALNHLRQAIKNGYPDAILYFLENFYAEELMIKEWVNVHQSVEKWNNATLYKKMGWFYYRGSGKIAINLEKAAYYFKKAGECSAETYESIYDHLFGIYQELESYPAITDMIFNVPKSRELSSDYHYFMASYCYYGVEGEVEADRVLAKKHYDHFIMLRYSSLIAGELDYQFQWLTIKEEYQRILDVESINT